MFRLIMLYLSVIVMVLIFTKATLASANLLSGAPCYNDNSRCRSGYCFDMGNRHLDSKYWHLCARESAVEGKVGGGGRCQNDAQCFSNYCIPATGSCSADSDTLGKIGSSGICARNSQCKSGLCKTIIASVKTCDGRVVGSK